MVSYRVIGQSTPRTDGVAKVTGKARYAADVALPGTLWGKVLHSPYAHARIVSIDTAAAARLPGVHAVITGADTGAGSTAASVKDVPPLARDRVRFFGERVAAVAADDEDIAQRAVDLIEVEYEELPAVFTADEALDADAPVLHPDFAPTAAPRRAPGPNSYAYSKSERGDLEAGFAEADVVVEHIYSTSRVHQGYLEPQAVACSSKATRSRSGRRSKAPYNLRDSLGDRGRHPARERRHQPQLHRRRLRRQGHAARPAHRLLPREGDRPARCAWSPTTSRSFSPATRATPSTSS